MARGKGYGAINSDVVMVTTRHKGGDYEAEFEPLGTARRVSRITSTTAEDLDNIKSRSRRTDQALLSDISNKLAQADFAEPVRVRRGSVAGVRRIVVVPTSSPTLRQHRQSTPPPPRVVTVERGRRATSVPPIPTQTRVIQDDDFFFPTYRPPPRRATRPAPPRAPVHVHSYAPPPVYRPTERRRRAGSEPPARSDLAVANARRSLQRLEAELGVYDTEPAFTPVVVPSRKHVYRAASVPRSVTVSTGRPVVTHRRRASIAPPLSSYVVTRQVMQDLPSPRRVVYAEPRSPSTARRLLFVDTEESYRPPTRSVDLPHSYSSLRSKTVEARNKLDHARVLYDRYLPAPTGVPVDVQAEVDFKYGELAARMPVLERRPKGAYYESTANITPYKPALAPQRGGEPSYLRGGLRHPPPRPKVSETRRHAREVLCRTKGDPNYYNYN